MLHTNSITISTRRWLGAGAGVLCGLSAAVVLLAVLSGATAVAWAAPAAIIIVTTTSDELNNDGDCSLREALQAANTNVIVDACLPGSGADTIAMPAGIYTLTRTGANEDQNATGDLDATDPAGVTIAGAGITATVLDANGLDRMFHAVAGPMEVSNLTIQRGFANGSRGGGIHTAEALTLTNVSVLSNTATVEGGGVAVWGSVVFVNSHFVSNTAMLGWGGGVAVTEQATVSGGSFSRNQALHSATGLGGGLYVLGTASVSGTAFSNNGAGVAGGGALFADDVMLTSTLFNANVARNAGGARFAYGGCKCVASVVGTTFIYNTATITASTGGGGAYFESGVLANVTGTAFLSNTANAYGGGAYFAGPAVVTGTTFSYNRATEHGGGAYFANSSLLASVRNSTFNNNSTINYGGGAYFVGPMLAASTTFRNNAATVGGGAAFSETETARYLVNMLFAGNQASNPGAALFIQNAQAFSLLHTTIANPTQTASAAVFVLTGTVYITNTLIASHTIGLFSLGTAPSFVQEDYNMYANVSTPRIGVVGGQAFSGTAAFYNHTSYTLTATSEAIDAGVNTSINRDYFGNPRPQGAGYDIGYVESPYARWKTYLPGVRK